MSSIIARTVHIAYGVFILLGLWIVSHNIVSLELSKYLCKWQHFFLCCSFIDSCIHIYIGAYFIFSFINYFFLSEVGFLSLYLDAHHALLSSRNLLAFHSRIGQFNIAINGFLVAKWLTECQDIASNSTRLCPSKRQRTSFYF